MRNKAAATAAIGVRKLSQKINFNESRSIVSIHLFIFIIFTGGKRQKDDDDDEIKSTQACTGIEGKSLFMLTS
jgi:hypothetical protein